MTTTEHRYTLVIVDDAEESVLLFERFLQHGHPDRFNVHTFTDPARALDFITNNHVNVVVSDLHMPGMSGNDLLLKCKGMRKGIQFYVLTGDQNASAALTSFLDGADGYIMKPISRETVEEGMAQCINRMLQWGKVFEKVFKKQIA